VQLNRACRVSERERVCWLLLRAWVRASVLSVLNAQCSHIHTQTHISPAKRSVW
jgi:hypothetical protein